MINSQPLVQSCCCFVCPLHLPISTESLQIQRLHQSLSLSHPPTPPHHHLHGGIIQTPLDHKNLPVQFKYRRLCDKTHFICSKKHYLHSTLITLPKCPCCVLKWNSETIFKVSYSNSLFDLSNSRKLCLLQKYKTSTFEIFGYLLTKTIHQPSKYHLG